MICGKDLDDVFQYPTIKTVLVKDRYLGITKYSLLLGIIVYLVFTIVIQQRYQEIETPAGVVRTSLKKPSVITYPREYPYCSQYNNSNSNLNSGAYIDVYPCVVWDEYQAVYPVDAGASMFVTTRVIKSTQSNECLNLGPEDGCLQPWNTTSNVESYLANVESYTIKFDHSYQARRLYLATHNTVFANVADNLDGTLEDRNGNVLRKFSKNDPDIIEVQELLKAADLDLSIAAAPGESRRHAGVVLVLSIDYDNSKGGLPTYKYTVSAIPNAEYKVIETVSGASDAQRTILNRHGIKIVFLIGGTLGRFSFQTLLIQLASGLGLLSIANLVTDSLMLYVLPRKHQYSHFKYEATADFSDVRDMEKAGVAYDLKGSASQPFVPPINNVTHIIT